MNAPKIVDVLITISSINQKSLQSENLKIKFLKNENQKILVLLYVSKSIGSNNFFVSSGSLTSNFPLNRKWTRASSRTQLASQPANQTVSILHSFKTLHTLQNIIVDAPPDASY